MNAPLKNPYCQRGRIPGPVFRELVRQFSADEKAVTAAQRAGVSSKTATQIFARLRRRVAQEREKLNPFKPVLLSPYERRVRGRRLMPGESCPRLVGVRVAQHQLCLEWVAAQHASDVFEAVYRGAHEHAVELGYEGVIDLDTHRIVRLEKPYNGLPRDPHADNSLERIRDRLVQREKSFFGWGTQQLYLWIKETEWRFAQAGSDPEPGLFKLLGEQPI